jgi:hypothetical protein
MVLVKSVEYCLTGNAFDVKKAWDIEDDLISSDYRFL